MRLLLALLLLSFQARGATFWATDAGAGSRNGSSLDNAALGWYDTDITGVLAPGDTIYLCGEFVVNSALTPAVSGSAGSYVTYDGSCPGGAQGILNRTGGGTRLSVSGTTDRDYIWIKDVKFTGATGADNVFITSSDVSNWKFTGNTFDTSTSGRRGIRWQGADVYIANNTFTNITGNAIYTTLAPRGIIENNTLTNVGTSGAGSNTDGIAVDDGSPNTIVRFNNIVGVRGTDSAGIDVQDNTTVGAGTDLVYGNFIKDSDGYGISAVNGAGGQEIWNYGNIVINATSASFIAKGAAPLYFWNNDSQSGSNTLAYHFRCGNSTEGTSTFTFTNNVFSGTASRTGYVNGIGATCVDNDNRYPVGGTFASAADNDLSLSEWTAAVAATNSAEIADPGFIGGTSPTSAAGFKLKAGSALRRAGTDLNIGNLQDAGNRAFHHRPSSGAWEAASGDTAETRPLR